MLFSVIHTFCACVGVLNLDRRCSQRIQLDQVSCLDDEFEKQIYILLNSL